MRVEVERPDVTGDAVRFRWTQSQLNPYQREDGFFIRYEGIDLTSFSVELFYEVFLALQVKVFAAFPERVELVFPAPLPKRSADFWLAFHNAGRVTITPLAKSAPYSPWTID